jgi:PAS domain S-box-containing protein
MSCTQDILNKIRQSGNLGMAIALDKTDLDHLIAVLKSAEEKDAVLNSIVESSDDAIISKDLNGTITSWNSSAQRMFGYLADEMIGQSVLKLIPLERHDEESKILSQLRQGIRVDHFETQRRKKDGSLIDVSLTISPIFSPAGDIIGVSKIVRDMTLYRKAEVDGRRLMAIIESSDDAIISKDLNSIITSWNASATRIFGYSADEMIGQSILKIIPPERHGEEPKILAQLSQGIRVDHFETQRLRKDGTLIDVSLTISPIKNWAGEVVGLSKIARDITDKKLVEQKKHEFVGLVSHELKTPLTSLKSYLQIAKKKVADTDFIQRALEAATQQTKKMETMIGSFLHLSRIEGGHIHLEKSPFNLSKLIEETVTDARIASPGHQVSHLSQGEINTLADREKISMVLTNLISNAQKYSPDGGEITISCIRKDNSVLISVSDQGMGISASDQKRLFQKFARVESEQTRAISGFGIGLYLVSTILSHHGSDITLESVPGKGSTFSFALELAE